jgi:hypothetical protein
LQYLNGTLARTVTATSCGKKPSFQTAAKPVASSAK